MEFLVEFELEVSRRHASTGGEAARAGRVDRRHQARGGRASRSALETTARRRRDRAVPRLQPGHSSRICSPRLPLADWAARHGHAARGAPQRSRDGLSMSSLLPDPSLTRVYRLEATLGEPLEFGDIAQGRRRIVPLTGVTFTGPELNGKAASGLQRRLADRSFRTEPREIPQRN